jgi:hypothetical protein
MTFAIHYFSNDDKRVIVKHFIGFSISGVIQDIKEELGVDEADICAVILLES